VYFTKFFSTAIVVFFVNSASGYSENFKFKCKNSQSLNVQISESICKIENRKWKLIKRSKEYILCEISDPQLETFEMNLITNKAIYEDTDTDELYEFSCHKN
jgi:hypothetical protein